MSLKQLDIETLELSQIHRDDLPAQWKWTQLGEICKTTSGGTPSRKYDEYFKGNIPWVKSGELPDGPVNEVEEYITNEAIKNSSAKVFPEGTLLIALYGATVGKLGILNRDAATNQAVCAIFPNEDLCVKYLFWYLRFVRSDLVAQAIGGAQPNISQGILRTLPIPIAPFDQQKRIVAEVEKQLSRLDEAVANLRRVKANLKRYKAAILKAAVEGHLVETEAELARREDRSYKTGAQLLQSILETRIRQWKGNGKDKEPATADKINLKELPEGWVWATVSQLLVEPIVNGLSIKESAFSTEVRALRLSAMSEKGFDYSDHRFLPTKLDHVADIIIREGDVFVSRGNGSLHLVCRSTVAQSPPFDVIFPDTMMRLRLAEPIRVTAWFQTIWSGTAVRRQIERRVKTTAGIYKISQPELAAITIPLPPFAEQHRIVSEVERRLSILGEVEAQVVANLKRAASLRKSVLASAFNGSLSQLNK